MGQKVNPIGLRLGINKDWASHWVAKFSENEFAIKTVEDEQIRRFIDKELRDNAISKTEIFRTGEKLTIVLYTAKPGSVIGRKGQNLEQLRKKIEKNIVSKYTKSNLQIKIKEVKNRYLEAKLVGLDVAKQIEGRMNYKRAIKKAIATSLQAGAKGIKIRISGRLGGAEMARSEIYHEGRIPLSTLRADIDFAIVEANTKMGLIGLKIWIYRGDKLNKD